MPILLRAIVASLILAAVVSACSAAHHDQTPPTIAAAQLDTLLLSVGDIDAVMKTDALFAEAPFTEFRQHQELMPNTNCLAAWQVAEQAVYTDSKPVGMRGRRLSEPTPDRWDRLAVEAVVAYPSAVDAQKFFAASSDRWSKCTHHRVNLSINSGSATTYLFGELTKTGTQLSMPITQTPTGKPCQHTLSVHSNVIVDVAACADGVTDEAREITQKIEDRVAH